MGKFPALPRVNARVVRINAVKRIDDCRCHHEPGKPLVVGWDDIPRCAFVRGVADHVFVGTLVFRPKAPFVDVRRREFPVLLGDFDPFEKPAHLLLLRYMEEEFEDGESVVRQIAFKAPDVPEALLPDVFSDEFLGDFLMFEDFGVHANDEGFLVVASVENTDAAAQGKAFDATPEEVFFKFFLRRSLEGKHLAALGVYPGHNVLDGAIFTRGVHGLENEDESAFSFGVEAFLEMFQDGQFLFEQALRLTLAFLVAVSAKMERICGI